jgi:hypothetical protein
MPGLVADTHALVWYLLGSERLSDDRPGSQETACRRCSMTATPA